MTTYYHNWSQLLGIALALLISSISSAFSFIGFSHSIKSRSSPIRPPTAVYYIQEPTDESTSNNDVISNAARMAASETSRTAAFKTSASENPDSKAAVNELLNGINDEAELIFLFVGQYHADSFEEIVSYVQEQVQPGVEVVTVLGGGVIGGGDELDKSTAPAMSLLSGNLPNGAKATLFQFEEGVSDSVPQIAPPLTVPQPENSRRPPSYMVFSDPFAPLDDLLEHLEQPHPQLPPPVVAGGVTVPPKRNRVPSIARNGKVLPAGSLVGVQFTGTVGLQAVVAQGCRPVGPTFVITEASNTVLTGLSGESAISRLDEIAANAEKQDQELIRNGDMVCGIGSSDTDGLVANDDCEDEECDDTIRMEDDFLIRQIMGFRPQSGSIVVAAGGLKEGNSFRFHVRAAKSAREDMDLMIQRAKTERLFAGSSSLITKGSSGNPSATVGKPLAAFQFSCVARGSSFYGAPNVDLRKVEELFDDKEYGSPIAGFFANGEIGPVGIRSAEMAAKDEEQSDEPTGHTFLHGFTTVVAMLCDYSETSTEEKASVLSSNCIIVNGSDDAWA